MPGEGRCAGRGTWGPGLVLGIAWLALVACGGGPAEPGPTEPAGPTLAPATEAGAQVAEAPQAREPTDATGPSAGSTAAREPFVLRSAAFDAGEPIPQRYSCDGQDVSPPLSWNDPPPGTASLALIMDDPDAPGGTWMHWVLYDLPPETRGLPESVPALDELPAGGRHGENSWGRRDYGGPCPPSGTHRYFFKLYALDALLDLPVGVTAEQLAAAMEGHVLAQAELMGTYGR